MRAFHSGILTALSSVAGNEGIDIVAQYTGSISFAAYSLVKHLEYRVKLQYKKISPEKIRRMLINVQTSILYNKKKKIRYGLPSKMTMDARKIYDILKIRRYCTPYIIKKM